MHGCSIAATWIDATADLVIYAGLIAGFVSLLAMLIAAMVSGGSTGLGWTPFLRRIAIPGVVLGLLAASTVLWDDLGERLNPISLLVFMVAMSLVMWLNGVATRLSPYGPRSYGYVYISLGALPLLAMMILAALQPDHWILIFETAVVTVFALFWVFQTVELWTEMAPPFVPADAGAVRARLDPNELDAIRSEIPNVETDQDGSELGPRESAYIRMEVVKALDNEKRFFPILLRGDPIDFVAHLQMEDLRNDRTARRRKMPSTQFVDSLRNTLSAVGVG